MAISTQLENCMEAADLFRKGLLREDPMELSARITKLVASVERSPFKLAQNRGRIDQLKKDLLVLATKPPKKVDTTETLKEPPQKDIGKQEKPEASSSLIGTIGGGLIAVPKFVLWTVPSTLVSGAWNMVPSFRSTSGITKPVDVVNSRRGVSSESVVNSRQAQRVPVGLYNENGDDCFLNSVRQFVYNTPIAKHIIPNLDQGIFPNTIRDFANYQAQRVGTPMGGSKLVRNELMPIELRHGHQDSHEALMKLFIFIEGASFRKQTNLEKAQKIQVPFSPENMLKGTKNPLFNWVESTRTFDLTSLPRGITYDDFTASSKIAFRLPNRSDGVNVCQDLIGPLTLSIKSGRGPVIKTLQGIWDNFANPDFDREVPSCHVDEFGAYLDKSTVITPEMQRSGRIVANKHGETKVLPDKVGEHFRFLEPPDHLLFSLKRYTARPGLRYSKINDEINVGETFRLDHRHIKDGKAADYRIKAFMLHRGGASGGHYLSFVLNEGQWYECNDSSAKPVTTETANAAMRHAYTFYAERTGKVSESEKRVSLPQVFDLNKMIQALKEQKLSSISRPETGSQDYLSGKPPIGVSIPHVDFKGKTLVGTVNQSEVVGGSNSCAAQALGFLAKTLNGTAVTQEGLKLLLEENAAKFRSLLEEQQKNTHNTSLASHMEWGSQGVIDTVVEEIEKLVEDHNIFMKAGAQESNLASYLSSISMRIAEKYRGFYTGQGRSALEKELDVLISKRLEKKMTKEELASQVTSLVRQDGSIDCSRVESAQRLHDSAYSGETRNVFSVYPTFEDSFGNKGPLQAETVHLDADPEMRTATLRSVLSQLRETYLTSGKQKAVGSVLSCNGYTYSVALVQQEDGLVQYQIFDSHGNRALTGSDKAFVFQTNNEAEATQFLSKLIVYQPVTRGLEQFKLKDQNKLGSYVFIPAPPKSVSTSYVKPVLGGIYTVGSYTVSGVYTVISLPFRGLYGLYSYATSSSGRSTTPPTIKKATAERTQTMSSQALGAELAKIQIEISSFERSEKAFTETDLNRLGDVLHNLQSALEPHENLKRVSAKLSQYIATLYGRIPDLSSRPTSKSPDPSDPRGLLPFYRGEKANAHGFTLKQILEFDDTLMEKHHNFIQWIFPTRKIGVDPQAPLLDPGLIAAVKGDRTIQANLINSFDKMLAYYGLNRNGKTVTKASNFANRKKYWTINGSHNLLRMTRIISSMGMLGFKAEAKSFGECILDIGRSGEVSGVTGSFTYWKSAIRYNT